MNDFAILALFNSISIILGRLIGDNERLPSGHMVPKLRRIDVVATSSRRIDVNTTSFYVMCPLGVCSGTPFTTENISVSGESRTRDR